MKKIKPYLFAILVIMSVMCLTACGTTKGTDGTTKAGTTTTQTTTAAGTKAQTTTAGATKADEGKESTGVVNDAVKSVEKGVDKITGESNGQPTTETTKAAK
ncbi:hypothetical protein ACOAOT_06915 [Lacrimispora sp. AGF001]|jgi:hypothetical protein|uniref:hypothetical protein n=1 Tax=Lacrimispora sp. AGF001 TaxID=3401631 RepID=UPI003B42B9F4|nr:hypothetical protein [Paenibacillaceae bacterium]